MRKAELSTGPVMVIFIAGALVILLLLLTIQQGLIEGIPKPLNTLLDRVLGNIS